LSMNLEQNKLECLSTESFFRISNIYWYGGSMLRVIATIHHTLKCQTPAFLPGFQEPNKKFCFIIHLRSIA
jgi:hypothetical protein